jgi:photosystem II stability/assembly factor-like uncharacterized protein
VALGTQGNEVVALTAGYLARSEDGGRTWSEERLSGPLDDSVQQISAAGKHVAIVANGPTAFVSGDGGQTWSPGPDLGKTAEALATDQGILYSTNLGRVGQLAYSEKLGTPWRLLVTPDGWGQHTPRLLAAEGGTFVVNSNGNYVWSKDAGETWQTLQKPSQPADARSTGLLHNDELLLAPSAGLERSVNGGPFESISTRFPLDTALVVHQLLRQDSTYYAVGGRFYSWRTGTKAEVVSDKFALSRDKHDYVTAAATHEDQLLVLVQSQSEQRLLFSRNRGKSWKEVMIGEPKDWLTALAASDAGFLVGTGRQGLWLVTLQ